MSVDPRAAEEGTALDATGDLESLREMANALDKAGNFSAAAEMFVEVRAREDSVNARRDVAVALMHGGDYEEAARILADATSAFPDDVETQKVYGIALNNLGHHEKAERFLRQAVDRAGDDAVSHSALGEAMRGQGRLAEALAQVDEAIRLDPTYTAARQRRASVLRALGRVDEAVAELERLLVVVPGDSWSHATLGLVEWDRGRHSEAVEHYRQAVRSQPDDVNTRILLANALYDEERYEQAAEEYRVVLQHEPDRAGVRATLAGALMGQESWALAAQTYREVIGAEPGVRSHHSNLGFCLSRLNENEEALKEYRSAMALPPDDDDLPEVDVFNASVTLTQLGRWDEADEVLKTYLDEHSGVRLLRRQRGSVLKSLGRGDEAVQELDAAIASSAASLVGQPGPEHDHYLQGDILMFDLHRYALAAEAYSAAVKRRQLDNRSYPEAHIQLANALLQMGRLDEAVEHGRLAMTGAEDDWADRNERWNVHDTLGAVLVTMADRDRDQTGFLEAVSAFDDALRALPQGAEQQRAAEVALIYLRRGYAYYGRGRRPEARADFAKCRDLAGEFSTTGFAASRYLVRLGDEANVAYPPFLPYLISGLASVVLLFGAIMVVTGKVTGAAFVSLALGMVVTVIVGFSLPAITRLKLGGAEFEKTSVVTELRPLPRLPTSLDNVSPQKTVTPRYSQHDAEAKVAKGGEGDEPLSSPMSG